MATKGDDDRWKDLKITDDEVDRIGKALKDEKFRKMFVEYAEEISDPKNRELYEQEIAQMEAEKGMDVQFIHPKPGHVLKVMVKCSGVSEPSKAFINICQNEHIAPPTHEKRQQPNGKVGLQWSIPHSFSPAREDIDKNGGKCSVYDVVFHPDTYKMSSNPAFQKMIHDTAFEGLEKQLGLQIDRQTMVKLKHMQFKGRVEPTIMRKKKEGAGSNAQNGRDRDKENDPLAKFPYPYEDGVSSEELAHRKAQQVEEDRKRKEARVRRQAEDKSGAPKPPEETDGGVMVPEYTLTNQYGMDMADYSQSLSGTPMTSNTAPSALVVSIHLPKLNSAAPCKLDVTERNLSLESTNPKAAYKLTLKLPYPVNDENGAAKFDKTKKQLIVTLPVCQSKLKSELAAAISMSGEESTRVVDLPSRPETDAETPVSSRPLIEVLSSSDSQKLVADLKGTAPSNQAQDGNPKLAKESEGCNGGDPIISPTRSRDTASAPSGLCLDSKILYKAPSYTFDQDEESVLIVLEVPRVNAQSFKSAYHKNVVEMLFSTVSPSGFVSHYYLKCSFPGAAAISSISKEVAEKNVLVTITKMCSEGLWDGFRADVLGSGDSQTQEHRFITKADIQKELEELGISSNEVTGLAEGSSHLSGAEEKAKEGEARGKKLRLTVDIKADEDGPMTAPEVVHRNNLSPNIHGILKRTFSESSADDLNGSGDGVFVGKSPESLSIDCSSSSSPLNDLPSPRERKKSVSFSDKVEETMFKSKDSVCHMHKALLNRRKKQRQRENRSNNRRNSSTEHSSGDEPSSSSSSSSKSGGGRRRRHSSSTSDDGLLSPRSADEENASSPRSDGAVDLMTSSMEGSEGEGICTCVSDPTERSSDVPRIGSKDTEQSSTNSKPVEPGEGLNSDDEEEVEEKEEEKKRDAGVTNWSNDGSYVEKTKCAFGFNNSVIFDLDE